MWETSSKQRDYTTLELLYPPRIEHAIPPANIETYRGYIGQPKYNDVRILIYLEPGGSVHVFTRRKEPLLQYTIPPPTKAALLGLRLNPKQYQVLDGGLLRGVQELGRRPIVVWDILVADGKYLVGTTYEERFTRLKNAAGNPEKPETTSGFGAGTVIADSLWLSPWFQTGLAAEYQRLIQAPFIEGLVLKNPKGVLAPALRELNNASWQVKVRKPSATYAY